MTREFAYFCDRQCYRWYCLDLEEYPTQNLYKLNRTLNHFNRQKQLFKSIIQPQTIYFRSRKSHNFSQYDLRIHQSYNSHIIILPPLCNTTSYNRWVTYNDMIMCTMYVCYSQEPEEQVDDWLQDLSNNNDIIL